MKLSINLLGIFLSGFIGYAGATIILDGDVETGLAIFAIFIYCTITYMRKRGRE